MARRVAFILGIASALLSAPAAAHRPYFTQVERILLPDGEMGEVRLLNGDGIMGPDPVRVLLIDRDGRLQARSKRAWSIILSCRPDRRCTIFDVTNDRVLELDPANFRLGPVVPGLSGEDRDELWDLEDGNDHWGFAAREPSLAERSEAYRTLMSTMKPLLLFNGIAGAISSFLLDAALVIIRTKREQFVQTAAAALTIGGVLGLALFPALVSSYFTFLAGVNQDAWLLPFALGALVLQFAAFVRRALRSRTT